MRYVAASAILVERNREKGTDHAEDPDGTAGHGTYAVDVHLVRCDQPRSQPSVCELWRTTPQLTSKNPPVNH